MTAAARNRFRSPVLWGLVTAIIAELCSVGLLAASGWFITASAIAGLTAGTTFSYIFPSGLVRGFAIGRIAFQYVQRLLLHRGALERIGTARGRFFRAVGGGDASRIPSGELLDRAVHDTETAGMSLITATSPAVVFGAAEIAGVVAAVAVAPASALVVVAFGVSVVVIATVVSRLGYSRDGRASADRARAEARAEIVDGASAWAELVSLGAAGLMHEQIERRLRTDAAARRRRDGILRTGVLFAALAAALSMCGSAWLAWGSGGAAPELCVLLILLGAGLSGPAIRFVASVPEQRAAAEARSRLESTTTGAERAGEAMHLEFDPTGLRVLDYRVVATPFSPGQRIETSVADGEVLAVVGRSGAGKTTLIDAMREALDALPVSPDSSVSPAGEPTSRPREIESRVDDYLFTGTAAENLRLGAPEASDDLLRRTLDELGLEALALDTRLGYSGRPLSGGERTRFRIARALVADPDILIVDEPFAGLDDAVADRTLGVLDRRCAGRKLVLATHDESPLRERFGPRLRIVRL